MDPLDAQDQVLGRMSSTDSKPVVFAGAATELSSDGSEIAQGCALQSDALESPTR
jgi:hypothetical protein